MTYPEIVASYERYDDNTPFQPITLECAVPSSAAEKDTSKLSVVVTYKRRYTDVKGDMVLLSFGLGEAISVNAILGLPTLRSWKMVLDIEKNQANSKTLNQYFELSYQHADTGLPSGITFSHENFICPSRPNNIGGAIAKNLLTTTTKPTVLTSMEDGIVVKFSQDRETNSMKTKVNSE